MANPIFILDQTEEGVVATHPARVELPVLTSPTVEEDREELFNTVRPSLVTLGCMNLSNRGFEFDSSFISPKAKGRFTAFAELMSRLRDEDPTGAKRLPPITIFGHADPTGDEEYNKTLSGRRARAVFGLLTRDVKLWETLFSGPFGGDDWGQKSIQLMLQTVGGGIPFYDGPIDGAVTPETRKQTADAIEAYQNARDIQPPSGIAGPKTRAVLFPEYMKEICQLKSGVPFELDPKEHFLARGKDAGHKGDVQGCGEFNPVLLLSQEQEKRFKDKKLKPERDASYEDDRRALVFIFKHDSEIDSKKWPCPRSNEGSAGCKLRFWSDSKDRLRRDPDKTAAGDDGIPIGDGRRDFKETGDTFACRWYHGFAQHSPCEAGRKLWVLRLRVDGAKDAQEPLKQRAYVVHAGETSYAPVLRGFTDDNGQLVIPVMDESVEMKLKLDFFGLETPPKKDEKDDTGTSAETGFDEDEFKNEDKFVELTLDAGALTPMTKDDLPAQQRLHNLGFGQGKPGAFTADVFERAIRGFQRTHKLTDTGKLDDDQDTREQLRAAHDSP